MSCNILNNWPKCKKYVFLPFFVSAQRNNVGGQSLDNFEESGDAHSSFQSFLPIIFREHEQHFRSKITTPDLIFVTCDIGVKYFHQVKTIQPKREKYCFELGLYVAIDFFLANSRTLWCQIFQFVGVCLKTSPQAKYHEPSAMAHRFLSLFSCPSSSIPSRYYLPHSFIHSLMVLKIFRP